MVEGLHFAAACAGGTQAASDAILPVAEAVFREQGGDVCSRNVKGEGGEGVVRVGNARARPCFGGLKYSRDGVALTYYGMALAYGAKKNVIKKKELLAKAYAIQLKKLGKDHPDTKNTKAALFGP
mgnify:CR=1 FL=1